MTRAACFALTATILAIASPAARTGDLGHEVTALIAHADEREDSSPEPSPIESDHQIAA